MDNLRLGIAGFGFVGQAVYGSIKHEKRVVIYDKFKNTEDTYEKLLSCDVIFACLPTLSTKEGQDSSPYDEFFKDLIAHDFCGIVVIKSTLLYSNLKPYEDMLKLVHNPEFLNQNSSVRDFKDQHLIVLGGRLDYTKIVHNIYESYFILREDVEYEFCTIEEAMNFKYVHNVYHAYKVLFWNMVEEELGNSRKYSDLYHRAVERNELSRVCTDGKKGYGGACVLDNAMLKINGKNISIKEFYENFDANLINMVESTNDDINQLELKLVEKVTCREVDEELIVFETKRGKFICTEEHLMPVYRDNKIILIEAKNILESDELFCN